MSSFQNAVKHLSNYQKTKLISQIWKVFLTMALVVLNDCYDLSDEEMQTFAEKMDTLADSLDMELDDFETIERKLREECGVKVNGI